MIACVQNTREVYDNLCTYTKKYMVTYAYTDKKYMIASVYNTSEVYIPFLYMYIQQKCTIAWVYYTLEVYDSLCI